jgi:hypothetical protein
MKQSVRDIVTGDLTLEYFAQRFRQGWKVATIEWVRESSEPGPSGERAQILGQRLALPYGLQLGQDGFLEENPLEAAALLLILDQIVQEYRIQDIAGALNAQGYSTREGRRWTAADIFNLMPRVIEAGPALLKSEAWQQRAIQRPGNKLN